MRRRFCIFLPLFTISTVQFFMLIFCFYFFALVASIGSFLLQMSCRCLIVSITWKCWCVLCQNWSFFICIKFDLYYISFIRKIMCEICRKRMMRRLGFWIKWKSLACHLVILQRKNLEDMNVIGFVNIHCCLTFFGRYLLELEFLYTKLEWDLEFCCPFIWSGLCKWHMSFVVCKSVY